MLGRSEVASFLSAEKRFVRNWPSDTTLHINGRIIAKRAPCGSSPEAGPSNPPVQESIPPEGEGHQRSNIKQQAAHQSTTASVQRTAPSCYVRFWFEDNGIGIPRQYQERIFSMFQQLDKSYEGTGIGLALVRKTAERMNGNVGVESEPGKGSRFWLEFQAAP